MKTNTLHATDSTANNARAGLGLMRASEALGVRFTPSIASSALRELSEGIPVYLGRAPLDSDEFQRALSHLEAAGIEYEIDGPKAQTRKGGTPEQVFERFAPGEAEPDPVFKDIVKAAAADQVTLKVAQIAMAYLAAAGGNPLTAAGQAATMVRVTGATEQRHAMDLILDTFPWTRKHFEKEPS